MNITSRTYRFTGVNRILGAQAANPNVRSEYIASKAATLAKGEEENEKLPDIDAKGLTVFLRDDGALCLSDYVIKGFLKESLNALKSQLGIVAPASKVDNYVLITPAYLRFTKDGQPVTEPDEVYERPLRAMTMQGPRVSLSASEVITRGWEIEFTINLLENAGSAKSKPLTWELIEEAMNYGLFKGLGQWRNGQHGRFRWKRIA